MDAVGFYIMMGVVALIGLIGIVITTIRGNKKFGSNIVSNNTSYNTTIKNYLHRITKFIENAANMPYNFSEANWKNFKENPTKYTFYKDRWIKKHNNNKFNMTIAS